MMDQIKRVLAQLKSNLLIVISMAVLITAIVGLFVGNVMGRSTLAKAGQVDRKIRSYETLVRETVQLPPENPGEPPIVKSIVPTQPTIAALKSFYERMGGQVDLIAELSIRHNRFGITDHPRYQVRDGHFSMTEGLFPEPADIYKPFDAMGDYKDAFRQMLGPYSANARYPSLNAGPSPDMDQIQSELDKIRTEFLSGSDRTNATQLTPSEKHELEIKLRKRLLSLLTQHAYGLHIYVAANQKTSNLKRPDDDLDVFDIGEWAGKSDSPSIEQLWLGQMGLWIQADIVEAIARVNHVDDRGFTVVNAPVKRLIKIEVNEGFVGIDNIGLLAGGLGGKGGMTFRGANRPPMRGMGPMGAMGWMGAMGSGAEGSSFSTDGVGEVAKPNPTKGFWVAHTGRQSNPLFDVWHARVTVLVDSQRLPELFNALSEVNFMTVLRISVIRDVDEYEALQQGFVYGQDDVVEAELVIETVWLRQWTAQFMPNAIKSHLQILKPGDPDFTLSNTGVLGTSNISRFPGFRR